MSALMVPVPLGSDILKNFAVVSHSRVMSAYHEAKLSACYLVLMEDYPEKAASIDLFVECIGKLRSNGIKINENGLKGVPAVLLKNLVRNKAKYNDERLWLEYEMTARVGCMVFMQQASIYIMEKGELYRQLREMTKTEKREGLDISPFMAVNCMLRISEGEARIGLEETVRILLTTYPAAIVQTSWYFVL